MKMKLLFIAAAAVALVVADNSAKTQALLKDTKMVSSIFSPNAMRKLMADDKIKMANEIVITANRALELIDSFKNEYVMTLLGMDWASADGRFNRSFFNDSYLPNLPPEVPYTPEENLDYELTRSYSLMQRCVVSLENLILDQAIKNIGYSFCGQMNDVISHVKSCLDYMEYYMNQENCLPNNQETDAMTSMIYEEAISSELSIRDFVILRDVRDSFANIRDTFIHFQK